MAQTFHAITPVDVTPGVAGSYQDVDCSSYVPAGATGAILHYVGDPTYDDEIGLRKNGSTYDQPAEVNSGSHVWAMAGLDANRVFECYFDHVDDQVLWLIGYTTSGVTFLDNPADISLGTIDTELDIDCSTPCPNAIGIIVDVVVPSYASFYITKNGSTDEHYAAVNCHHWVIIGCDDSQIIEGKIESLDLDFFIVGYITDGCTFFTNAYDKSLGSVVSYIDIDCSTEAPDAIFLFFEITSIGARDFGLRTNGQSGGYHDIYKEARNHPWAFVECDSGQVVEGKIEHTDVDFFVVGYAEAPVPPALENKSANMGSKMVAAGLL